MQTIRTLITENNHKNEHFSYYESIIEIIEQNVSSKPDICIEGCKALIEGISKSILKNLDATFNQSEIDKLDFQPLFKKALLKLSEHNKDIEVDFVNRACSLIQVLGEIRNKRGDISHGKLAPKELFSYSQFSKLVMHMTEGIVFYVLEQFFATDFSYQQEIKYEENMDFNRMLDAFNPIENLSYSKALFDQDYVTYCEELTDYRLEQENNASIDEV